jgi:ribosomal protein L32E
MIRMALKRRHFKFVVPNFGFKNRKTVKDRWRKQRGEDNKTRVGKKGSGRSPKIGYKRSNALRYRIYNGLLETVVHNEKELLALKNAEERSVRFAHDLSRKKRAELKKLADANKIKIRL